MAKILQSALHKSGSVDPFGFRPCSCEEITVHITDAYGIADDIVECVPCGWSLSFGELFKDVQLASRGGSPRRGGK